MGARKDDNLPLLRAFRDNVLASNNAGKDYISMLYSNSLEILTILIQNKSLTVEAKEVADEMLPGIRSLLNGGEMLMTKKQLADFELFLTRVESKASPHLKTVIRKIKDDIEQGGIFKQLGITISLI